MQLGNVTIKNSASIERRFTTLNFINSALVVFALIGNLFFFFLIFKNFHFLNARISILLPSIHFFLFLSRYMYVFLNNFVPVRSVKTKYIGVYKKDRIVDLCDTLIKENFSEHDEIPTIYIVKNVGNNAFAYNSLILNFVKELNSIILSKELFSFLSIKELSAIIGHEIGHFKKYISIAERISFIPYLFLVLGSYIITSVLFNITGIVDFILYLLCFVLIKSIWNWPLNIFQQDIEFLADLYSANKYGKLNMINALIKIYQMDNIDFLINIEVSKYIMESDHLQIANSEKLRKKIKRKISKKLYDEELILHQITTILKGFHFKNTIILSENTIKKRNRALNSYLKNISKMMNIRTIKWEDVDNNKRDGRIDSIEYKGLIETLMDNPELQLFKTPNDNIRKMKFKTHPTLRERILFMEKNCSNL